MALRPETLPRDPDRLIEMVLACEGKIESLQATIVKLRTIIFGARPGGAPTGGGLLRAPKLRRGERFDWLYDRTIEDDDLLSRLAGAVDLPSTVWEKLLEEKDHELRAALVCLITAAFSARGKEPEVGDDTGGWFWLPSKSLWQPWAIEGLANAVSKCGLAP